MARLAFAIYGTWGDVASFEPIARELAHRGHDVTMLMPEELHSMVAPGLFGLASLPVEFTPSRLFADRDSLKQRHGMRDSFETLQLPYLRDQYEALRELAESSDLLVTNPIMGVVARMLSERQGTPWVVGGTAPMFIPSRVRVPPQWPLPALPGPAGRAVNRLAWRLQEGHHGRTNFDAQINEVRTALGLPALRGNLFHSLASPHLTLVLMSPRFFEVPTDWPARHRAVGFPVWTPEIDPAESDAIEEFLAAGEPPVLVSRGTLGAALSPEAFEMIADVLDELGARSILTVGSDANITPALRQRSGVHAFLPLPTVIPRCRAVIHGGGLGTLGAVLRGGVPSAVLPETAEAGWSARRIEALGLGVRLPRGLPSRRELRRALDQVLRDGDSAVRAREFAASIASEDAAAASADAIESFSRSGVT